MDVASLGASRRRRSPPHRARRPAGPPARLARRQAVERQDRVPPAPRRQRRGPGGRQPQGRRRAVLGGHAARGAGVDARDRRHGPRRCPRARRPRDPRPVGASSRALRGVPDHQQGARHGVPHGAPPPVAALEQAARGAAAAQRDRAGHPRLLLRARVRADRLADPHAGRVRRHLDAVPDRLLRRSGVPQPVRAALPRARRRRARQGLLLRADLPRREVEDAAAPDGVLDGRARGRVHGVRGTPGAGRGVRGLPGRARARSLPRGAGGARARHQRARAGAGAVPARALRGGAREATRRRVSSWSGAPISAPKRRPRWRSSSIGR